MFLAALKLFSVLPAVYRGRHFVLLSQNGPMQGTELPLWCCSLRGVQVGIAGAAAAAPGSPVWDAAGERWGLGRHGLLKTSWLLSGHLK